MVLKSGYTVLVTSDFSFKVTQYKCSEAQIKDVIKHYCKHRADSNYEVGASVASNVESVAQRFRMRKVKDLQVNLFSLEHVEGCNAKDGYKS